MKTNVSFTTNEHVDTRNKKCSSSHHLSCKQTEGDLSTNNDAI